MRTRLNREKSPRVPRRLVVVLVAHCSLALAHAAHASEHVTALSFSTTGRPLFGPSTGGRDELGNLDIKFIDEHVPPTSKGQIKRVTEEVPVSALQNVWQRALDQCLAQSYTVPVIGTQISPTTNECITGTVARQYCTVPPKLDWDFPCADKRTYTRNVGAGIGPRPTQPADRPYDVGAVVTYQADVEMGVRGKIVMDGGSVDVAFAGTAAIDTSATKPYPATSSESRRAGRWTTTRRASCRTIRTSISRSGAMCIRTSLRPRPTPESTSTAAIRSAPRRCSTTPILVIPTSRT
jgi:hypothetical protein